MVMAVPLEVGERAGTEEKRHGIPKKEAGTVKLPVETNELARKADGVTNRVLLAGPMLQDGFPLELNIDLI